MSKATIRRSRHGDHYTVHHNFYRTPGRYSREGAESIRNAINSGKRTGCPCKECQALRNRP